MKTQEGERKIVGADYLAPDQTSVAMHAEEKDNPRLRIDVPANKMFIEVTDTNPPYVIVVARADNPVAAKGALAHAHDILLLLEHKVSKQAALSLGVAEAAMKDLKTLPPEGRLS